jgi:virulence-associated protein VapD
LYPFPFVNDPIMNVIQYGIKNDIEILMDNKGYRGVLTLIYSGIDALAFAKMPALKNKVERSDFISFCIKYINLYGIDENNNKHYKITGEDLYGARCSILHTYGHNLESTLSQNGQCKRIVHCIGVPDEAFARMKLSENDGEIAVIRIEDLKKGFFNGINQCLVDIYENKDRNLEDVNTFENRIKSMIQIMTNAQYEEHYDK